MIKRMLLASIFAMIHQPVFAEHICDNMEMLNIIDRPTFARGVCVVPAKKSLLELGATHFKLLEQGESNEVGEGEYRFGLGRYTELDINPPNYYQQTVNPKAGFGYTTIGIKSIMFQNHFWAFSLDGALVPSGGSSYFGARGLHGYINGIWFMDINEYLSHALVVGYSTYGEYNMVEFEDFGSFNFDYSFSTKFNEHWVWFNEFYGQNKSHFDSGLGIIFSTGLIYLIHPQVTLDIKFGQRVVGELNNSVNFIGIGGAMKFF